MKIVLITLKILAGWSWCILPWFSLAITLLNLCSKEKVVSWWWLVATMILTPIMLHLANALEKKLKTFNS